VLYLRIGTSRESEERYEKVAVIGASGFLGTAVVERLLSQGAEVVPFITAAAMPWRLARMGLFAKPVDILSSEALGTALAGCTHVVNCSRGEGAVMLKGLKILSGLRHEWVKRLVHISSVAVYGDPPHPQSTHEDAPTEPGARYIAGSSFSKTTIRKAQERPSRHRALSTQHVGSLRYLSRIVDACRSGNLDFWKVEIRIAALSTNNLAYAVELGAGTRQPDAGAFSR
jgi:UDP-glucose 4-epimerase